MQESEFVVQVVELIRAGSGNEKKILVIDQQTEKDIRSQVSLNIQTQILHIPPYITTPNTYTLSTPPPPPPHTHTQGGDIVVSDATVMIPRTAGSTSDPYPSVPAPTRSPRKTMGSDEPDGLILDPPKPKHGTMPGAGQGLGGAVGTSYTSTAQKVGNKSERVRVKKQRDWRSSIEAYNNL